MVHSNRLRLLTTSVSKFIHRKAWAPLNRIIAKNHPGALAEVINLLEPITGEIFFKLIENIKKRAEVLSELDDNIKESFLENMLDKDIARLIDNMDDDDAANILRLLPPEMSEKVLEFLKTDPHLDEADVQELLKYDEETAGGIMTTDVFSLPENTTAGSAIKTIRDKSKDYGNIFYIYITNDNEELVGVISLRDLIVENTTTPLKKFMKTKVISVTTDVDQEEVAKIVATYNLLAIPVIDTEKKLVGIITVDDIVDVIREEATEDILKMGGAGDTDILDKSIWNAFQVRMPWLFITFIGGLTTQEIIKLFDGTLSKMIILAAFIPIIAGMGGNIGSQAATIVVRGLAVGKIQPSSISWIILKELKVALMIGLLYGILLGSYAFLFNQQTPLLGVITACAIPCAMLFSSTMGILIPITMYKIKVDPAIATGPLVTTLSDITGLFLYFSISWMILTNFNVI